MGSEGKLCLLQVQNQHTEAAGHSAGVGAEICSWPGCLGAVKSQGPLLPLQHGLFWHWQAADASSGSWDIMKILAQEAALLKVCVHTGKSACPDGAGHPVQHCGTGRGWGESQASANKFWELGKEAPPLERKKPNSHEPLYALHAYLPLICSFQQNGHDLSASSAETTG